MKKSKLLKNLISVMFVAFLFIMLVMYFVLPKDDYSPLEKRYLSKFPEFTFSSLLSGDYTADIETYLADRTPGRSFFVGINSYYNLAIGNNGSNDVYLGKNGMLIEKPVSRDNILERNVENINSFAHSVDIPFTALVVPSKGFIYSDNLPQNSLEYYDDKYFDYLKNNFSDNINFVNITEQFLDEKNQHKLYYNTDHHWTSYAAFTAYKAVCKSMGLEAMTEDSYTVEEYGGFHGTSYSTSAYYLTESENVEVWRNTKTSGKADVSIIEGSDVKNYDNMFFDENLKTDDKYTVFLDGNHSMVKIHNESAPTDKKLLVIKDSFAHCLTPFLADNFKDITMVDLRYYKKSLSQLIEQEQIDEAILVYGISNLCTSTDIVFE